MAGLLPSIVALGTVALVSVVLAARWQVRVDAARRPFLFAIACQSVHFVEEAWQDFHIAFPALFGQPPIPWSVFIGFNLTCIGLWLAAASQTDTSRLWIRAVCLFLALAGMLNGIAHPAMAVASNSYFPGLGTSVPVALACGWLWYRLRSSGEPD